LEARCAGKLSREDASNLEVFYFSEAFFIGAGGLQTGNFSCLEITARCSQQAALVFDNPSSYSSFMVKRDSAVSRLSATARRRQRESLGVKVELDEFLFADGDRGQGVKKFE